MKEDEVREFMTDWFGPGFEPMPMLAWSVRKRSTLMGSATSKRFLPTFRPFDLLAEPNQSLLVFENPDQRVGVESVCGAEAQFKRHLDFNTLLLPILRHDHGRDRMRGRDAQSRRDDACA
jgi:hypothetical protein